MAVLTYADSGVDRDAADRLVDRISAMARSTYGKHKSKLKASIGGYASLYQIDGQRILAASTDGVGTKLKLAFHLGVHDTVGIDLVAMSVNDLICTGAEPLFFLDYFATGKLNSETAEAVLKGITEGCRQAGCALVGGETAEMPDFYSDGEYDLGGFAVGMMKKSELLPKPTIKPGDVLIGVGSSGFHSNGFSLLRKLLPEGEEGRVRAKELLQPTKIYVRSILPLLKAKKLKGLAHITGSGFLNVPRISNRVNYRINLPTNSELPSVFQWVKSRSGLPLSELATTFNMGLGLVVAVAPKDAEGVIRALRKKGEKAWPVGEVLKRQRGQSCDSQVTVQDSSGETVVLAY